MKQPISISTRLTLLASMAVLTGCASITSVPPGTPYKDVVKQFGNPAVSCPAPNGGTKMVWTQEPSGEEAWMTIVGSDKRVGTFTQVLRPGVFDKLNQGSWTAGQVRCEFGPPARTEIFPDKPNQVSWEYRYSNNELPGGYNYMMLYIVFDRTTNKAVGYSTGPDPDQNLSVIGGN